MSLKCPYKSPAETLFWRGPPNLTLYSNDSTINDGLNMSDRIKIVGNASAGEYSLHINEFDETNAGIYRCDTTKYEHEILVDIAGSYCFQQVCKY